MTPDDTRDRIAAAQARLAERAAARDARGRSRAAEAEERRQAAFRWRLERLFAAGTDLHAALATLPDSRGSLTLTEHPLVEAWSQIRLDALDCIRGLPLRFLVRLDARLVSVTCTQQPFTGLSQQALTDAAVAFAEVEADRIAIKPPAGRYWWQDED
jgi:hypothetical protein